MARRRRPPRPGALTELPPLKILSQILALQGIYYASAIALILFTTLVMGTGFSLDMIFGWDSLRGDTTRGWMLAMVWMLNAFLGAIAILFLISRSKLVPDFVLTLHFIHLVLVSLYSGAIPSNLLWWILQLLSAALMGSLGVWSCRYRELRPINFGTAVASSSAPQNQNTAPAGQIEQPEEEDVGFLRGGRRGRGRDGAGEYEMAGLKADGTPVG